MTEELLAAAIQDAKEAEAYASELEVENKALTEALCGIMIGGNHLATWLPVDHASFESDPLTVLEQIGAGMEYDIWCCWRSIMQGRKALALAAAKGPT